MLNYTFPQPPDLVFECDLGKIKCSYKELFGYRFNFIVGGIRFVVYTETTKHDEIKEIIRIFSKRILQSYNLNDYFEVKYFDSAIILVAKGEIF